MLTIIARTTFKSIADRDVMANALAISALKTVKEPGVLCYQFSIDRTDPLVINAVEIYRSMEAMEAHAASDHMAAVLEAIADIEADITLKGFKGEMEPFDLSTLHVTEGLAANSKMTIRAGV
jgi:quinol monooxygenase YgiN